MSQSPYAYLQPGSHYIARDAAEAEAEAYAQWAEREFLLVFRSNVRVARWLWPPHKPMLLLLN